MAGHIGGERRASQQAMNQGAHGASRGAHHHTAPGTRATASETPASEPFTAAGSDIELVGDLRRAERPVGEVVLLHGGGQTRHSWGPASAALARRGWTTITFDARGHGDSGWSPRAAYAADDGVGDLRAVVASVCTDTPVLIGASLGGVSSLLAVGENPGFARALVLVDIVPQIEPGGADRINAFMTARPDGFATLDEAASAIRRYNPHRTRPVNPTGLRKNLRQRADGRWYWHWDPALLDNGRRPPEWETRAERLRAAAAAITVPALLVRGTESDIVSDEGVADLLAVNPAIQVQDVPATGHMVAGDDNTAFGEALLGFLDGLIVT